MTYQEAMAGLQLVAERDIGIPHRQARAEEDLRMDRSAAALKAEQDRVT